MPKVIRLSQNLVMQAWEVGRLAGSFPSQQIEYWVHLGKIAEDHSELSVPKLFDILNAQSLEPNRH
ncbi:ParD-like family protein [Polynucleobacter sp. UK-Mo-2m-Kol15]|uniref:ParD-like family protein n=1 Tax=Polynucleobacter sp. UK-Mo-2m-Kol15 TaxID=2576916 RepID=UPI002105CF3A|nr:ParD-like family protein [Polynucleobacter sp. UK-Mo-2m-Kol15]